MGLKNLNKVLINYDLYNIIDPKKCENLGSYIFIDLNCILYQCTYNTLNYEEFSHKVIYTLEKPLKYFISPQLHIYLDYGIIEIKEKLRNKRNVSNKKYLKNTDYIEFYDDRILIIEKITKDIHDYFNLKKIYTRIIYTNETLPNMDAEYKMIKDAKDKYWCNNIFPVFYSNDQDVVYLLARNQIKDSIIIQKTKDIKLVEHMFWELKYSELTCKISLLTLMFEGNDYIKGLIGITSEVLIVKKLTNKDNLIEYSKKIKIIKKLENHIKIQLKEDVKTFYNEIETYTSLTGDYYLSTPANVEMLFVDYISTF
jgi:hypothetical protein